MALNLPPNTEGAVDAVNSDVSSAVPPQQGVPLETPPTGAPGMTPDEMIADLEGKAADVEGKNASLKAKQIIGDNNLESIREDIIRNLFSVMEKNGIDPGDPQSVRDFLEKLAESDPDLFEIFENAFTHLMGEGDTTQAPDLGLSIPGGEMPTPPMGEPLAPPMGEVPPAGDQGLMGKYSNLAGEVMR